MNGHFFTLPDGREIRRILLRDGELTASVLTLGAVLQDLRLAGTPWPLVLGSETPADYLDPMKFYGAIVGPVANRIAGASLEIGGKTHRLEANEGGRNTLHGGDSGTWAAIWKVAAQGPAHVVLSLDLADGHGSFPGNRRILAEYRILPPATLSLVILATTDAPTPINLAHHAYWNMDGTTDLSGHRLTIAAGHYTPVDSASIPTGEVRDVTGTGFDFRAGAALPATQDVDHNFCLADARRDRPEFAAELRGRHGPVLRIETTEPGLQIYDAARMNTAPHIGLMGQPYGGHGGLAIEPQGWPDAPHHPNFPSILLEPGQTYRQETRFILGRDGS